MNIPEGFPPVRRLNNIRVTLRPHKDSGGVPTRTEINSMARTPKLYYDFPISMEKSLKCIGSFAKFVPTKIDAELDHRVRQQGSKSSRQHSTQKGRNGSKTELRSRSKRRRNNQQVVEPNALGATSSTIISDDSERNKLLPSTFGPYAEGEPAGCLNRPKIIGRLSQPVRTRSRTEHTSFAQMRSTNSNRSRNHREHSHAQVIPEDHSSDYYIKTTLHRVPAKQRASRRQQLWQLVFVNDFPISIGKSLKCVGRGR
jgi:hypothetical protein